jgi:deazaflavin-dependent oxidoreductase (nitroreductase family)
MTPHDLSAALDRIAVLERGRRETFMHRVLQRIGPTRPFVAVYRRLGPLVDPWLLRRSGGRIATQVYGFPALLLLTTGAKTGRERRSPLIYARDGDAFLVVGTNFGTRDHPGWTANLLKNPEAAILVGEDTLPVRAELLDAAEFERNFPKFSAVYGGYDTYLKRLEHRTPRMFRLSPVARSSDRA